MTTTTGQRTAYLTLQAPTRVADGAGGYTETWTTLAHVWGALDASATRMERSFAAQVQTVATTTITIPYVEDVTPACRVVYGTRTYNVRGVADPDQRRRELVLACEEVA